MYPDLLEIFGVKLHGVVFERVLMAVLGLLMLWGIISSIQDYRKGNRKEAVFQGVIVLGILGVAVYQFVCTFQPNYQLLFKKPLVLHSYAFCILVGVVLGTLTAMRMAKSRGWPPVEIAKLCILLIFLGFIGARLAHVVVDFGTYWDSCFDPQAVGLSSPHCLRVLDFGEGGLTFYGGVIGGLIVLAVFFYRRIKKGRPMEILPTLDTLAAPLAIAHGCGRIGCIAAGCCWGAITTGDFGFTYDVGSFAFTEYVKHPELHDAMMESGHTPLLHATQLYEVIGEFTLYGLLWLMHVKKIKPGRMAATWLIGYGVLRFIVEFMRDDSERGYYFEKVIPGINRLFDVPADHSTILSTSQGIALGMITLGLVFLALSFAVGRKGGKTEQPAEGA